MATEDNLRDRAKEIRGAFEPSSVTNEAVGGLLLDIINFFIDYGGNGGGGGKPDVRYWSKEELKMLDQYLYVLNDKIKALYADSAGDSELFKGHKWEDYFDQPVRTYDPVKFNSVTSPLFVFNELTTPEFVSGLLGVGTRLKDNHLELDEITVRKRMNVFELLIQRVRAVGGQLLLSSASIKISTVEELENGYKCSFNTDDQTIPEPFVLNDQAFHQTFTGKGINRYWRLTTEAGDDYFVLSKTDCEPGSGIPQPGDEVILLGNRTDKARQSAMMLSAYGNDAPYLDTYDGINDYNLSGKLLTREGNLTGIVDEVFGQLSGSGFYGKNVYLRGKFALSSGVSVEDKFGQTDSQMNNLQGQLTNQQGQLNTQQGQITNIQTDILAIPGQIKQEVSQTVTHEVDNLQIGMVNLLKGSNVELEAQAYAVGTYYFDKLPEIGKTYTLVICYTLGANNTHIIATEDDGRKEIRPEFSITGSKIVESRTFKYSSTRNSPIMAFYQFPNGTYGSTVHWAVLVEGNKGPNAWIPSLSEQGETAAKDAVDNLQIGAVNLVSRKMMLAWNEKNKDIALWGQDADGIYLGINQGALYNYVCGGAAHNDLFGGTIKYKDNTQYVFQVKWKLAGEQTNNNSGVSFWALYTDGTSDGIRLGSLQTSLIVESFITKKGKTVAKIFSSYGVNTYRSLIYSLALYEGNKVLAEPPVATEDLTGQSNVNLVDGGKEVTVTSSASDQWGNRSLVVPKLKPNTVYYLSFKAENLTGSPTEYSAILYNKEITTIYHRLDSVSGGIMITPNNFTEGEAKLFLYAGKGGSTAGNSVKYKDVMLVEGFTPPSSYSPSPGDVQKEFDEINNRLGEWASDGYISPQEKTALRQQKSDIQSEQKDIEANANRYVISLASYMAAYNAAIVALDKYTATSPENIAVESDYNNIAAYYPARQTILNSIAAAAKAQVDKATGAIGMDGGKMLYKDPEFRKGLNNVYKYTNSSNVDPDYIASKLTVERVTKPSDAPTQSGYCLKVTCKAAQTPGYGGVYQPITSRANAVFVQKIIAKIPVGRKINTAFNSMGTGYTDTWLTSNAGTGKYETYVRKVVCGTTGNFNVGGHVYISGGPAPTEAKPLEWYIAYMTAFDLTADGYGDIVDTVTTEFNTKIDQKADSVTVSAMRTDLNSLGQVVNQQGSQLQVNTNSIDAIVTKNGSGTIVSIKPEMVEITGATVIQDGNGNKVNIFGIGDKVISVNGGVFSVDGNGKVIMQNAEIAGKVTAKTGKIGPFEIGENWLTGTNMGLSGSQISFNYNNNDVYVGSNPIQSIAGGPILGTFKLSGGSYNGITDSDKIALLVAAPTSDNYYALAVTSGRVLMKGQMIFNNVVSTGSNVTLTASSGHFVWLYPVTSGSNPTVTIASGLPVGSWFVIGQTSAAGGDYYIKMSGSDKIVRRGNSYGQVHSHNQDPSFIFKVGATTWILGNLPVNWIEWS